MENAKNNVAEYVKEHNVVVVNEENIAKVNVCVEEQELEPYKKHLVKEKRKNVALQGYRKGKAPEKMIASRFKEEIRESAKNNAIYNKYIKLLQEHRLQALEQPKLEDLVDKDGRMEANLSVEVLQPVVLGQYMGLELQQMPPRSVDDGVKNALNEIKQLHPKFVDSNEPAQNGGSAVVDFKMSLDGNLYEEQKDFRVKLGSGMYFEEFEKQILGSVAGTKKQFTIHFPETYAREELRNKKMLIDMEVKSVQLLEDYTDEELAGLLKYGTTDKMMESITSEVDAKYKDDERLFYENQVLGQLLSAHQFKIPKKLLTDEINRLTAEKKEMSAEEIANIADRFVRTDLVLSAIYERHPENHMSQEDFNSKIAELATRSGDSVEGLVQKLQASNKLQAYVNYLKNNKVVDFLIEMSEKKEMVATESIKDIIKVDE